MHVILMADWQINVANCTKSNTGLPTEDETVKTNKKLFMYEDSKGELSPLPWAKKGTSY